MKINKHHKQKKKLIGTKHSVALKKTNKNEYSGNLFFFYIII